MGGVTTVNPTSQRGRPGYSRDDVIRAAVRAFNSRGYDATSMGHVAQDLGISKSALYHHITSKEEILEESVAYALSNLEQAFRDVVAADLTPGETIRQLIYGSVAVLCADAESVTLLLRLRGNSEVELRALSRRRELTRSVIPLIAKAQESGEIRSDISPAVLTRMCFGLVNSLADWYEPDGELGPERIAQDVVALLFGGLDSQR